MAATDRYTSSLPVGFTVHQPALGSQLQFYPARGSQRLDDMINAFFPGPYPVSEKLTMITLDFCQYAQQTGQNSKFYPVQFACPASTSPSTASPSVESINSSHNVSPLTPSWDWSATCVPPIASSSSGTPPQHRRQSKSRGTTSKYRNNDLSHIPGMKILSRDGVDVTNVASRGSKSKEQRDHAHLMRIMKACDSCRRKKIKCDRSHKRPKVAHGAPQSTPKPFKKARTVPSEAPPSFMAPPTRENTDMLFHGSPLFGFDSNLFSNCPEYLDSAVPNFDLSEYLQVPASDTPDIVLPFGSDDPTTMQFSHSSFAEPWQKLITPSCQVDSGTATELGFLYSNPQAYFPVEDFTLYSPRSEFSEDERMLSIGSKNRGQPSSVEPGPECPLPSPIPPPIIERNGEMTERNDAVPSFDVPQVDREGGLNNMIGGLGGSDQLAAMAAPMGSDGWASAFSLRATRSSDAFVLTGTRRSTEDSSIVPSDTSPGHFTQRDISVGPEPTALTTDVLVTLPGVTGPGIVRTSISARSRNMLLGGCLDHLGPATADGRGDVSAFSARYNADSSGAQRPRRNRNHDPGADLTCQSAPAMADHTYMELPKQAQQNHVVANPESSHPESLITSVCRDSSSCGNACPLTPTKSQSADAKARSSLQAMSTNCISSDLKSDPPPSSSRDENCSIGVGCPQHAAQQGVQQGTWHTPDAVPWYLEVENDGNVRNVQLPIDLQGDEDEQTSYLAAARAAGKDIDVPAGFSYRYMGDASTGTGKTNTCRTLVSCNLTKRNAGVALANERSTPTTPSAHKAIMRCDVVSLERLLCAFWKLAVFILGNTITAWINEFTADIKSTSIRQRQSLHKSCQSLSAVAYTVAIG
ncbi:hypothetical protein E4U21_001567 [Claviceps maximensis]|nr:hypothetical protein E4U21_001567 [Claviceps maximensis]